MSAFRYLELFAGAGGLSLGLDRAGWTCAAHAEIHADARAVLAHHWPDVPLAGDVRAVRGDAFGDLLLVSGGSPCQDLSVAGKRAGLAGARSGLYHEQVRVWEESGAPYFLWENVLGALSSHRGADFAAVLSALVGAPVAVPRDGWGSAGVVAGPRGVAAWRCLDAQWFGVPQRRRRVFVLGARAGGCDPAEVLLEPQGVRRDSPTRGETGQESAAGAGDGTAFTIRPVSRGAAWRGDGADNFALAFHPTQDPISGAVSPSLGSTSEGMGVLAFAGVPDVAGTLESRTTAGGFPGADGACSGHVVAIPDLARCVTAGEGARGDWETCTIFAPVGIPRRLMPVECEALMDWPRGWTDVPNAKGKPMADAARYRLCGNGVVSRCAEWIGWRLKTIHAAMVADAQERAA